MGAVLWSGTARAARFRPPCPRCSLPATVDCDRLGRTVILCACSSAPFLMPLATGGAGQPWPIDLTGCDEPDPPRRVAERLPPAAAEVAIVGALAESLELVRQYEPREPREPRSRIRGSAHGRVCTAGCGRAVGPRGKYCRIHAPQVAAEVRTQPCVNVDTCGNRRSLRSPRCADCRREFRRRQLAEISKARTAAARAARGGVDRRRRPEND